MQRTPIALFRSVLFSVSLALSFASWPMAQTTYAQGTAQSSPGTDDRGLGSEIEKLLSTLAKERKLQAPRLDKRLSQAASALLSLTGTDPPAGEIINEAMHLHGVVEPSPHLVLSSYSQGDEAGLLADLRGPLSESLGQGRWRRLGVSTTGGAKPKVLILLLESFIQLSSVPRAVPKDAMATPIVVRGQILPPYVSPQVLITEPDGRVARLPVSGHKDQFSAPLHCLQAGRYQIEVTGEDRFGVTVLANFPVYCGVPAPTALTITKAATEKDRPFRNAAEAEAQVLELLNADRVRYGLAKLTLDPRLSDVARAHSKDMREGNFIGHVSPKTGNAGDRVSRAGIPTTVLLENLAKAYTPREAERGLMESPGHRANIISKDVTHVGIGIEVGPQPKDPTEGREIWVTQLFAKPAAPFDEKRAPQEAYLRVQEARSDARLAPLTLDVSLSKLAQQAADGLAQGAMGSEQVGGLIQNALPAFSPRFRAVRTVMAQTSDLPRLSPSPALKEPGLTHIGVGVARENKAKGRLAPLVHVVFLLATEGASP